MLENARVTSVRVCLCVPHELIVWAVAYTVRTRVSNTGLPRGGETVTPSALRRRAEAGEAGRRTGRRTTARKKGQ